jgi:hypothetical protein
MKTARSPRISADSVTVHDLQRVLEARGRILPAHGIGPQRVLVGLREALPGYEQLSRCIVCEALLYNQATMSGSAYSICIRCFMKIAKGEL